MLCLRHDALLQNLRRVIRLNRYRFLCDNRAAVCDGIDKVHRSTGYLYALRERRLMNMQSIEAIAAERRNE